MSRVSTMLSVFDLVGLRTEKLSHAEVKAAGDAAAAKFQRLVTEIVRELA